MGECQQQKHTRHALSTKTECDYLNGWIKKTVTYAKISPKSGEPQRYSWGTQNNNNKKTTIKHPKCKQINFILRTYQQNTIECDHLKLKHELYDDWYRLNVSPLQCSSLFHMCSTFPAFLQVLPMTNWLLMSVYKKLLKVWSFFFFFFFYSMH